MSTPTTTADAAVPLHDAPDHETQAWWRDAVTYQVYIRSFADGSGDGIGDIAGLRSRLGYLADLGVDAIWINPWYPSPMADGGYDVADYRAIEPVFGTLAEADGLIADAHDLGLRVMLDIVPNHTSDRHEWFQAALAAGPGSPERARYHFRDGTGPNGDQPPNNWHSLFGGRAWTRVTDPDGRPGQWYLHLFAAEQPDLNWTNPQVRREFEAVLRFWFDRGVDGFRIDVAHALAKKADLPDLAQPLPADESNPEPDHPYWNRSAVHDIYRGWREVADSYDPPRAFVAEAWVRDPERLALYVRPDELHTTFNFPFLQAPWRAADMHAAIDSTMAALAAVGAPATWVLSNHDVARQVSRYARVQGEVPGFNLDDLAGLPADLEVGHRRARAAAMLMLALPGGAYLYQGEELGLPEVEDLPDEVLADPTWTRSHNTRRGRDGCRVPIPWSGKTAPFGFSSMGAEAAWLPQPATFGQHAVAVLDQQPDSILNLYRRALRIRRQHPALGDGELEWLDSPRDTLMFIRRPDFRCVVNFGADPIRLPLDGTIILASTDVPDETLPPDTCAWLVP